jgi:hypothetical protein
MKSMRQAMVGRRGMLFLHVCYALGGILWFVYVAIGWVSPWWLFLGVPLFVVGVVAVWDDVT